MSETACCYQRNYFSLIKGGNEATLNDLFENLNNFELHFLECGYNQME
ncbi:MAG: hypothetical protein J5720_01335 [Bacteroidaceae bacterium]|nr:hypothetical protein [Bacteroidaceae bacterium]